MSNGTIDRIATQATSGSEYWSLVYKYINSLSNHIEVEFWYEITDELSDIADEIDRDVEGSDSRKYRKFKSAAEDYIDDYFKTSVQATAKDLASWLKGKVDEDLTEYQKTLTEDAGGAITGISNISKTALEALGESITSVDELIAAMEQNVNTMYATVADNYNSFYEQAAAKLDATHGAVIQKIEEDHDKLVDALDDVLNENLYRLEQWYTDSSERVRTQSETALNAISNLYLTAEAKLAGELETVAGTLTETVDPVVEGLGDTSDRLGSLSSSLKNDVIPAIAVMAAAKLDNLGIAQTDANMSVAAQVNSIYKGMFRELAGGVGGKEGVDNAIDYVERDDTILGRILASLMWTISNALLIVSGSKVSNAAREQLLLQYVLTNNPVVDFSAADAASLQARRIIDESEAQAAALKSGVDAEKLDKMRIGAETPVDRDTSSYAWLRGLMGNDEYVAMLRRHGYNDTDIMYIAEMTQIIPPVQDLITMAVREVFTPEMVKKFRLFEERPDAFVEWGKKMGLSEDWCDRYWGAHWALPSASQGFEMYHRKLIDSDTLDMLIKALDVSPIWREPLKGIAYQPITRVDIRRIFQLGLIDRDEVKRRFEINGYSPEDAELMTKFYEVYTGAEESETTLDPKDITMSQVKKLHEIGTITREQAISELTSVGYDIDLATIYVQSWIDEKAYDERAALINRYTKRAIREDMNAQEIESLVYSLNLTADELKNMKATVEAERSEYDSIPSKSELFAMLKADIISYDQWYVMMRKHGYSDEIIGWYYQLKT